MMRRVSLLGAAIAATGVAAVPAQAANPGDWAVCLWRSAPEASQAWIALGAPSKKMDKALLARSDNLAFRLKAACAKSIAPDQDIDRVAFDKKAVWRALSKSKAAGAVGGPDADTNAFMCNLYFILQDLPEDAKAVPAEVLSGAAMQISAYQMLAPGELAVSITKTKQSNGAPVNLLKKCQRISTDGNLVDA
jgi:hypothetical protein